MRAMTTASSNNIIDMATIMQAIPGDTPVGKNPRGDISPQSDYYKLKDARNSARSAERKHRSNQPNGQTTKELWREVEKQAIKILQTQTKDLEIIAWLTEALLRNHGYGGLAVGFNIAADMIEQFWPDIYPDADEEDGNFAKVMPLVGLNGLDGEGTLIIPIRSVAITQSGEQIEYAVWQYQQAIELEKISDSKIKQQKKEQGIISLSQLQQAARDSGDGFYQGLVGDVEACINNFKGLNQIIANLNLSIEFPSSNILNALSYVSGAVKEIYGGNKATQLNNNQNKDQQNRKESTVLPPSQNKLLDREEALNQLLNIADYFRRTEPQSLVPYLLERTVKWGRLPLHELMAELVSDSSARNKLFEMTGIEQ